MAIPGREEECGDRIVARRCKADYGRRPGAGEGPFARTASQKRPRPPDAADVRQTSRSWEPDRRPFAPLRRVELPCLNELRDRRANALEPVALARHSFTARASA